MATIPLTSGSSAGADLDARNGIIENHAAGAFQQPDRVRHDHPQHLLCAACRLKRRRQFQPAHNTVQNVQGDTTASVAIINLGGSGRIANNTMS